MPNVDRAMRLRSAMANNATPNTQRSEFNNPSDHIAKDDLVGWAWRPGPGRRPAPGTQEQLGFIIQAWIDTGTECP